jgi:serine/threonine-protein kinase
VILKGLFMLSLLAVAFVVGVVFMDRIVMPHVVGQSDEVMVPDITERSNEEAQRILEETDLLLVKDKDMFDPVMPEGYVISQDPPAYTQVKKGRHIHVVVSRGSERLTVPDLTRGISLRTAEIELQSGGFELGSISYRNSDEIPKGVVMSQSPRPYSTASRGALVNITVSSGPLTGMTAVPNVIGMSLEAAIAELKEAGLIAGMITYVQENDLLPGTVTSQSIAANEEVERGTHIDLTATK